MQVEEVAVPIAEKDLEIMRNLESKGLTKSNLFGGLVERYLRPYRERGLSKHFLYLKKGIIVIELSKGFGGV
jgi:hypothetical protein